MSARSSPGSWSVAGDIIDLDKYMRPARPDAHPRRCNKFVVDAGGVDRKRGALAVPVAAPHVKRFSHDSGLSDGSHSRRRHRTPSLRRARGGDNTGVRAPRTPAAGTSESLREFRAMCERALLEQRAQMARLAQLCERLTECLPPHPPPPRRPRRPASRDTSDLSSSSRSTRDQRRKDQHRTEECKTYKIIMNKLDELNRLLAARVLSPLPRHVAPSSASVSVSDKLVATKSEHCTELHAVQVAHNTVAVRGESTCGVYGSCRAAGCRGATGSCRAGGATGACGAGTSSRLSRQRALANTSTLHIAPRAAPPRDHIAAESVAQCDSGTDPRCGFDLEDPVHLYSQAKRLQPLPATTRWRARSVEPSALARRCSESDERVSHRSLRASSRVERPRARSLCALCRGYWRAFTHYLAANIFCCPDSAAH